MAICAGCISKTYPTAWMKGNGALQHCAFGAAEQLGVDTKRFVKYIDTSSHVT